MSIKTSIRQQTVIIVKESEMAGGHSSITFSKKKGKVSTKSEQHIQPPKILFEKNEKNPSPDEFITPKPPKSKPLIDSIFD
jgi:hypothetical protein